MRPALRLVLLWCCCCCLGPGLRGFEDGDWWAAQPSFSDGLCRYGNSVECCWGWTRTDGGQCEPYCQHGCKHGVCAGPDKCICQPGYTGKACNQDLNECGVKPRPCKHRCMNTHGSYKCYCLNGYTLQQDGTCRNARTCFHANCQYGCEFVKGAVRCSCPSPGLRLGPDRRSCVDIDECVSGGGVCPRRRKCVNTFGSFLCKCHLGFKLTYLNGRYSCIDRDTRPFCSLNPTSPKCRCKDGACGDLPKVILRPHPPRTIRPTPTTTTVTTPTPTSTPTTTTVTTPTTITVTTPTPTPTPTTTTVTTPTTITVTTPTPTPTPTTTTVTTPTTITVTTPTPTTPPTTTTVTSPTTTKTPTTTPTTTTITTPTSSTTPTTTTITTQTATTTSITTPTTTTITTPTTTATPTTTPTTTTITTPTTTPTTTTITTQTTTTTPSTTTTTTPPITTSTTTPGTTTSTPSTTRTTTTLPTTTATTTSTSPITTATTTIPTTSTTSVTPTTTEPTTTTTPGVLSTTYTTLIPTTTVIITTAVPTTRTEPTTTAVTMTTSVATSASLATTPPPFTTTLRKRGDVHIPRHHNQVWEFDIELGNTGEDFSDDPEAGVLHCSFHHGLCDWMSDREGDVDWLTVQSPAGGQYLSVPELKAGQRSVRGARLSVAVAPPFSRDGACFSFSHRLAGNRVGTVQLFLRRYSPALWSRTGGHGWRQTQVNLDRETDRVLLKAERRDRQRGEIAIDDIILKRGAC